MPLIFDSFLTAVRLNCNISDAKDCGIYSMCMLFLRLRNLYKWENSLKPWEEADPPILLDWIASKEDYWDGIADQNFHKLPSSLVQIGPMETLAINKELQSSNYVYGAGLGRSLKTIFFLSKKLEERIVSDSKTIILGREKARELDSPFALVQDGTIYFRTEPFSYFLWDRVNEPHGSSRWALNCAMDEYGILIGDNSLNMDKFKEMLDDIVNEEMVPIIHHEVGELKSDYINKNLLENLVSTFPGTIVELLIRALKDILADVHQEGHLGWIIANEKKSSLGFYVTYVDGLRSKLFPGLADAAKQFFQSGDDWQIIEKARVYCLTENIQRAEVIRKISLKLGKVDNNQIMEEISKEIIVPLNI